MASGDLSRLASEEKMKVRVILVCTLLLMAAVPSFALPLCRECNINNVCEAIPGSIEKCYSGPGYCYTTPELCSRPSSATVLAEWKVASVDVERPATNAVTAATPAPEAEVPAALPTAKTSALK
jgi:hypothetical protein